MTFGQWLNSLTALDHTILFVFFLVGCGLAYVTIHFFKNWYKKIHKDSPYTHEMRITPFGLLGTAFIYTFILYRLIGTKITDWFAKTF